MVIIVWYSNGQYDHKYGMNGHLHDYKLLQESNVIAAAIQGAHYVPYLISIATLQLEGLVNLMG